MNDQPPLFELKKVPVLQNKVYLSQEEAVSAPFGSLKINVNTSNGLYVNQNFDPDIMIYDQDYDNSVPSKVFMDYYDFLADYLVQKYDLKNMIVVDIGCGKGTFLSRLASRYEFINAIGIDPSYEGDSVLLEGRLRFIPEYFSSTHVQNLNQTAFVICRHTLEHIASPEYFLELVFNEFKNIQENTLFFIEVPDLVWILEHRAFWDFCYEHVNYFTPESLHRCIKHSGGDFLESKSEFGNQYIWAEASVNKNSTGTVLESLKAKNYFSDELLYQSLQPNDYLDQIASRISVVSKDKVVVIWGMATKGIMYCLNLAQKNIVVDYYVDVNRNKQNKYIPLLGHEIISPEQLSTKHEYAIICMNTNYIEEIKSKCRDMALKADFYLPNLKNFA